MRAFAVVLGSAALLAAVPAVAQERFRVSVNAGQQSTSTSFSGEQTFQQNLEQGSFTFERSVPKAPFYDAGLAVRLWRGLHAGAAVSIFENTGSGEITARVPHPLFFNQQRTVTGEITGVERREVGQHVSVGWAIPAASGIDFMIFGGPSIFTTEQVFVTTLTLTLDKEVYPFDSLAFPGAVTEKQRDHVIGYHAGVDMTWRFTDKVGVGLLVRYAKGRKDFTPTGGAPVEIEVGGLHAGGGLRLIF
jgi:hypothetical protein